jgi:glycosyltransferase involved in cell wall biosynthesis
MNWIHSGNVLLNATKYLSLPDLVKKYSILIDIEGRGFSARTKFLLWSHRPLIIVDRPHNEYFFEYLKEWEHFIPVRRDLSDLVEKTNWILNNYDKALEIAENAYQFSKQYLTREACYKKWNDVITQFICKKRFIMSF